MAELGRKSVAEFKQSEKLPVVVVLDNVRSMHNVGSVFRTCDAFLVEKIILCGYTPQPPHRDIHKTALGATETVAWHYVPSAAEAVKALKKEGCLVASVEQADESTLLHRYTLPADTKLALIFGNEVEGVQDSLVAMSNFCLEIPQLGMKHSLNISVAAGIVLWHLAAQKLG